MPNPWGLSRDANQVSIAGVLLQGRMPDSRSAVVASGVWSLLCHLNGRNAPFIQRSCRRRADRTSRGAGIQAANGKSLRTALISRISWKRSVHRPREFHLGR